MPSKTNLCEKIVIRTLWKDTKDTQIPNIPVLKLHLTVAVVPQTAQLQ